MNFQDFAQDFTTVSVEEAEQLLAAQSGAILFLGRATCPYCNRFVPKLHQVAQDNQLTIHFLDTSKTSSHLQNLRDKYQVPTVPGLLYAATEGVQVRCDSSMTKEDILAFVQHS